MCFIIIHTVVQSQKAVSAYFSSKRILPFGFAEQNTAVKKQTAIAAHFSSGHLLLFVFALQ